VDSQIAGVLFEKQVLTTLLHPLASRTAGMQRLLPDLRIGKSCLDHEVQCARRRPRMVEFSARD